MTFVLVTGETDESVKLRVINKLKQPSDIIHKDVMDYHHLMSINEYHKHHKDQFHWIIINTSTKMYKYEFKESIKDLQGDVIQFLVNDQVIPSWATI